MKRRQFIIKSGVLGLGGMTACKNLPASSSVGSQDSKSLGVALVGLGSYSSGQLAPALKKTKHCHLAGIVTGSPEKIPVWKEKYGIKDTNVYNYDNMDDIANNDDIDVVYIVLPTGLHAKYAIKAANAGKHVWCEKPMAMNVDECNSIINACKKNKVKLAIGYRMWHEPNTQELISYRERKPFGEITHIRAESCYAGGRPSTWRAKKHLGGGAMYDMGVYAVNGIRYASGLDVTEVVSAKHIIDRPELFTEVDETTEFTLQLSNGLITNGMTSVGRPNNGLKVTCENGWYQLSPMQAYNGVVGDRSDGKKLDAYIDSQQARQMDDDALAILNNTPIMCPGIEGLKDIRIISGIFEAAKTGHSVVL